MKGNTRRRRRRSAPGWADIQHRIHQHPVPWGLLVVCSLLYAVVGLVLAAFPIPPWLWAVAIGATVIQVVALAGPRALRRFKWWSANLVAMASIVGAGGLAVCLSVALNHVGTDQLDDITVGGTLFQVMALSMLALVIAALTAVVTAWLGDALLRQFSPRRTSFTLAVTSLLSLGLGAAIGYFAI